jgi:hypothetical protein
VDDGALRLAEHSAVFARELQATLDTVLPGERRIVSRRVAGADRFIVQPAGEKPAERRVPIFVNGEHLAELSLSIFLDLDRTATYLKTVRSDVAVHSVLDRTPLVRLEYRADMRTDPIAHWQFHAERGAFSHLLARAHVHRPQRVSKPHDLSTLHLPVGGERFRPCLEDVLQFLVVDCGVDHHPAWEAALCRGRELWRRRQVGAAVRDVPREAARVLRELGWTVREPGTDQPSENLAPLTTW